MASSNHETAKKPRMSSNENHFLPRQLANEEIRDMLLDYVQETADPVLDSRREWEIVEEERRRGYGVTFFRPEPCYVLKTMIKLKCETQEVTRKAFINICQNDAIEKPSCKRVSQALTKSFYSQDKGLFWTVPHGLTYPRDDVDRRAAFCVVYDCVYHPDTLRLANSNKHFKRMIDEFALDAIENSFAVTLDRTSVKFPKMKYKGRVSQLMLRDRLTDVNEIVNGMRDCSLQEKSNVTVSEKAAAEGPHQPLGSDTEASRLSYHQNTEEESGYEHAVVQVPKYTIKHCYQSDMMDYACDMMTRAVVMPCPVALNVEIYLPSIESASCVLIDVRQENVFVLKSVEGVTPRYELDVKLPYSVKEDEGKANFFPESEMLVVSLPVLKLDAAWLPREKSPCDIKHVDGSQLSSEKASYLMEESASQEENLSRELADFHVDDRKEPVPGVNARMESSETDDCDNISDATIPSLPKFSCHQSNDELVFVINLELVNKNSVIVTCLEDGTKCHITFRTVTDDGSMTFYSLYLKFLVGCGIEERCEIVNVTEDNMVLILTKSKDSHYYWEGFDYGIDGDSVLNHEILVLNALQRKLNILQNECLASNTRVKDSFKSSQNASVTEITPERLTIEIEDSHSGTDTELEDRSQGVRKDVVYSAAPVQTENSTHPETPGSSSGSQRKDTSGFRIATYPLRKSRSLSESSDDMSPSHMPRSILKFGHRCRTRSESSDDYCWLPQDYTSIDSDIPEEELMGNMPGIKKSVHFNDVIYQNFFRSNSSILGQRKKNQRKQRKKRITILRRSSESEQSEGEVDSAESRVDSCHLSNGTTDRRKQLDARFQLDNATLTSDDLNGIDFMDNAKERESGSLVDSSDDNAGINEINQNGSTGKFAKLQEYEKAVLDRSKKKRGLQRRNKI